jgi:hypothetical protein
VLADTLRSMKPSTDVRRRTWFDGGQSPPYAIADRSESRDARKKPGFLLVD